MAKRKKSVRRKIHHKANHRVHHKKMEQASAIKIGGVKRKIKLVLHNLLVFVALTLVSFVLYRFISNTFMKDLFFVMSTVFGFISVAFILSLFVLFIIKLISSQK